MADVPRATPELGCPALPNYKPAVDADEILKWNADEMTDYVAGYPSEAEGMAAVAVAATQALKSVRLVAESHPDGRRVVRHAHERSSVAQPDPHHPVTRAIDKSNTVAIWNALDRYPEDRQLEIMEAWRARCGDLRPIADDLHEIAAWLDKKARAETTTTEPTKSRAPKRRKSKP